MTTHEKNLVELEKLAELPVNVHLVYKFEIKGRLKKWLHVGYSCGHCGKVFKYTTKLYGHDKTCPSLNKKNKNVD
jgi:hypothetical protein